MRERNNKKNKKTRNSFHNLNYHSFSNIMKKENKKKHPKHTHTPVGPNSFHNLNNHSSSNDNDFVVDVILRSSAAPVYFSAYQGFIDGGVFAK
jgi:patatin-like phospholipase/acyl hydrolase